MTIEQDVVIELRDVTFSYRPIKKVSLVWGGSFSQKHRKMAPRPPALKDINLTIKRGKKIGLIGKNGAGKTTLLRLIAGIYEPQKGNVIINTKSVSLVALGAGFDFNANGFENIYLNGLLNGLSISKIDSIIDAIIEFADIGDYIDYPLKTYSTGMRAKLAFSIAVHALPDVILLDEVLSVGDYGFQQKSLSKMQDLIREKNKTVIISSHSLPTLSDLCDEIVWLDSGRIVMVGEPDSVLKAYKESYNKK